MNKPPENDIFDENVSPKQTLNVEKPPPKHNISKKFSFSEKLSLNYIFSYETNKELNVLDRRLGYTYIISFIIVFSYIIIYIFLVEKLYLEHEKSTGDTHARIIGKSHSTINGKIYVWDESLSVLSFSESNSIFVPTKVKITKSQQRDECPSVNLPCFNNSDCKTNELPIYIEKELCQNISAYLKGCLIKQWCPMENDDTNVTEVHSLIGVSHQRILINSLISFPNLAPEKSYSSFKKSKAIEYPLSGANTFSIGDIIKASGEKYEDVENLGCILQVNIVWECYLEEDDCRPSYRVLRLDTINSKGFSFSKALYSEDMQNRDHFTYFGIRIYFSNVGRGYKASASNIIIQLYCAIALIGGAKLITDFLMLNFYREKKHYRMMKEIETKDMND